MELRLLRYFLTVAKEQSFTKAAEQLHITQPTLSRQMAAFEEDLGITLFIRSGKKISLTEEGILLKRRALEILNLEERTLEELKGKEEIVLNNPIELNNYLSSGTVKGMITFTLAQEVLKDGGYLIVDEIENHFNKEIVSTLIRFFMDGKINKNGGMLIFSTHYPELLDEYDRNDSIFITRNRDGITAENLSNILKRNDFKKSDAYQSGFLEGTTPTYEAYMQLKKSITASLK